MAVGASFAQLAVVMVDAKQGVLVQTRRHSRICSLMGIKHFVFAVNKMDLVNYSEERFHEIEEAIEALKEALDLYDVKIIPVSATEGDNVTKDSPNMPWYTGGTLLHHLETVDVVETENDSVFYMPVQRVCRPNHEFRGFQGQIESGRIAVGQSIVTLPSNETAVVKRILVGDRDAKEAVFGQAVTIQLDKEVDVSRGCVLTNKDDLPVAKYVTATFLWMDDEPLTLGKEYLVKLGAKKITGIVKSIEYKIDVNTGGHLPAEVIEKNEIAVCKVEFAEKIVVDAFKKNKTLGELILIDRISHMTSACGVVDVVDANDETPYFQKDELKTGGYIFEEFYFNLDNAFLSKVYKGDKTYHVGDKVPVEGDSFKYPDYFDIIAVDDEVAVLIRNREVFDIIPLANYQYMGLPTLDERGFALKIRSEADFDNFLYEHKNLDKDNRLDFHNKWSKFETYRRVVCTDNFWMI